HSRSKHPSHCQVPPEASGCAPAAGRTYLAIGAATGALGPEPRPRQDRCAGAKRQALSGSSARGKNTLRERRAGRGAAASRPLAPSAWIYLLVTDHSTSRPAVIISALRSTQYATTTGHPANIFMVTGAWQYKQERFRGGSRSCARKRA